VSLLLVLAALAAAAPYTDRTIQIAIVQRARSLLVQPESAYVLRDHEGTHELSPGKQYEFEGPMTAPAVLEASTPGGTIKVGGKLYRAKLIVRPDEGKTLTAIAEMSMENYLLGVVPYEMEPDWPLEALKAQAVVARTYAYYNLGKHRKAGFDLTADTSSQVYGGLGRENDVVRQAVRTTRGEVLGYGGELLQVFYHACCGGHTSDAGVVWGGKTVPPLKGVRDKWCAKSPYYKWAAYFTTPAVLAAASSSRMIGGKLRSVKIGARDASGQVKTFTIRAGAEELTIKAVDLRRRLGAVELRSTRVEKVKVLKKGVEFTGRGSGHGVGLCQWGARLQAEDGRTYETILKFYFPGSIPSIVDE
jgi:stage II sporulation protein D